MHFSKIAALCAFTASAQAWVIPEGTSNGVYSVEALEDGTEVHTKLSDTTSQSAARDANIEFNSVSPLEARGDGRIWCGCGFDMSPTNTDRAVDRLKAQLGTIIPKRQAFYYIYGDIVAFACNRDPNYGWLLLPHAYGRSLEKVTGACGRYIAGSTQAGDDGKALIQGYQRYKSGDDFCRLATTSPANHC